METANNTNTIYTLINSNTLGQTTIAASFDKTTICSRLVQEAKKKAESIKDGKAEAIFEIVDGKQRMVAWRLKGTACDSEFYILTVEVI